MTAAKPPALTGAVTSTEGVKLSANSFIFATLWCRGSVGHCRSSLAPVELHCPVKDRTTIGPGVGIAGRGLLTCHRPDTSLVAFRRPEVTLASIFTATISPTLTRASAYRAHRQRCTHLGGSRLAKRNGQSKVGTEAALGSRSTESEGWSARTDGTAIAEKGGTLIGRRTLWFMAGVAVALAL